MLNVKIINTLLIKKKSDDREIMKRWLKVNATDGEGWYSKVPEICKRKNYRVGFVYTFCLSTHLTVDRRGGGLGVI